MDIESLAKRYTGSIAERYDDHRAGSEKWRREQAAVETMLRHLERGARVLDVPVGTGRFMELYKRLELQPTGVDASADMLVEAGHKAKGCGLDASLQRGNIFHLEFDDRSFDAVICIRFLNWVAREELAAALSELARVTREHLIIGIRHVVPLRDMAIHTPAGLVRLVKRYLIRLRGTREPKLVVHRKALLRSLFARLHLEVGQAERVEARADGTDYFVYLLRRRPTHGEH